MNLSQLLEPKASLDLTVEHVLLSIEKMPWFYRLPIKCLVIVCEYLSFIRYGKKLSALSVEQRVYWVNQVLPKIPGVSSLFKLVRSLSLMIYFSRAPLS